jgi:geranylgeranyl diphosphate synthase type II
VLAFETLARAGAGSPHRLAPVLLTVARSVGMPAGIVAGQAWESEPGAVLADYQRAKTGALFAAASGAGAAAAGAEPGPWRALGELLGEAYQVVDDIRDVAADPAVVGKPVGRDAALGRPNAAMQLGLPGAMDRLERLVTEAIGSIPPCPGATELKALVQSEAKRFLPKDLARHAA